MGVARFVLIKASSFSLFIDFHTKWARRILMLERRASEDPFELEVGSAKSFCLDVEQFIRDRLFTVNRL